MPNYNHSHYLVEALDGLLAQTVRPLEVLVVDDASTDDSVAVIEAIAAREPVVRLIRNEVNLGVIGASRRALSEARGDFLYCMSADDQVRPTLFEKSLEQLTLHPGALVTCSDPSTLDDHSGQVINYPNDWSEVPRFYRPEEVPALIASGNIATCTGLIARPEFLGIGGLVPELRWHADWLAVRVLALRHGVCYLPETLSLFRIRRDSFGHAGPRTWGPQLRVLRHMIRLLNTDYRDVRHAFRAPQVFAWLGLRMLLVLVCDPRNWYYLSRGLISRALYIEAHYAREHAPRPARWLVKRLLAVYRFLRHPWRRGPAT